MPVSASTKMDPFASAAEDVAAAERAIQQEIDRKEKTRPKAVEKSKRNAGRRENLSGAAVTSAASTEAGCRVRA
jgi:hypothetical protein